MARDTRILILQPASNNPVRRRKLRHVALSIGPQENEALPGNCHALRFSNGTSQRRHRERYRYTFDNERSRSWIKSSTSSMPTDNLIRLSDNPAARRSSAGIEACVIDAG